MAQRESGYTRIERDRYETPAWVTDVLVEDIRITASDLVWEPAAGGGKMVRALRDRGFVVRATDIDPSGEVSDSTDFLRSVSQFPCDAIITNPPYKLAMPFVERALAMTEPSRGLVAMLLRVDFDSAKTRQHVFADCLQFAHKIVLLDRICWVDPKPGQAGPSENHAWFVWDWRADYRDRPRTSWRAGMPLSERERLAALRRKPKPAPASQPVPELETT